jgi:hypothetical protein
MPSAIAVATSGGAKAMANPPKVIPKGSGRRVPKATYVDLTLDEGAPDRGGAISKFNYVARLNLQPGEVAGVQRGAAAAAAALPDNPDLLASLTQFEGTPLPSELPSPAVFSSVPTDQLAALGKAIEANRKRNLADLTVPGSKATPDQVAAARLSLHTATIANKNLGSAGTVPPIGMLNLERLEMTPTGLERGDLIATIPLAPGETTTVFSKEWSVTTQEFTSIVTDSLANYSAKGVTENTELSQSTASQVTHNTQLNVNSSASGGFGGFVSGSTSVGFTSQDQNTQSAKTSTKDAQKVTKQASSRVKQEHKTTISNTTVAGTEETTSRKITNKSDSQAMRIDYYSLMSKWRVRLYRYGLRMTYDITIPEPGAALREIYAQLDALQSQVGGEFEFTYNGKPVTHASITADILPGESEKHYLVLADHFGVDVPVAPDTGRQFQASQADITKPVTFTVDENYWITTLNASYTAKSNDPNFTAVIPFTDFQTPAANWPNVVGKPVTDPTTGKPFLYQQTGDQSITFISRWDGQYQAPIWTNMAVEGTMDPIDTFYAQWQGEVWAALYNAAQTNYYAQQQAISAQISALQQIINGVDTLTLRREENDEIMKGVLRWILGPTFDFMLDEIDLAAIEAANAETQPSPWFNLPPIANPLQYGEAFAEATFQLPAAALSVVSQYEAAVSFINEAIEWENTTYFLYSYFWDVPSSWDFIRQIRHQDAIRQAFLRAGSARVVVAVRKGYEQAWITFTETGQLPPASPLGGDNPYMTIAQEINDYDTTNYPGIPPANPAGSSPDDLEAMVGTVSAEKIGPSAAAVPITVESSAGFLTGYTAVIDTHDSGAQEAQVITAVPDQQHIVVEQLANAHDGTATNFPIIQPGENGLLIAEWNEYIPSSGTDIAVSTPPGDFSTSA